MKKKQPTFGACNHVFPFVSLSVKCLDRVNMKGIPIYFSSTLKSKGCPVKAVSKSLGQFSQQNSL